MSSVLIVDFDDSFTYNIAEILFALGISSKVVSFRDSESIEKFLSEKDGHRAIIWGPGPGHPSEYECCFDLIKKSSAAPNLFVMGICLGHQLIWYLNGKRIVRKENPIHGVVTNFTIPPLANIFPKSYWGQNFSVQMYNSLEVEDENLKLFSVLVNGVTFQFHPESIGTKNQKIFFSGLSTFLK